MTVFSDIVAASLWLICTALAVIGCGYALFAAACTRRLGSASSASGAVHDAAAENAVANWPSVSVLKPLYGAEPDLLAHLESFVRQDYPGAVEVVLGVQNAADPAAEIVEELIRRNPERRIVLVKNPELHGANRKISNLINTRATASHDILVLADSDMRVEADYLTRVVGELRRPGVGLVTCLYHGLPVGGLWSRLSAMAIDHHFLPSVLVGMRLGLAKPCFGSTIALSAATLDRIGGFQAFSDQLADDYAMGAAVRGLGLAVAVPPMVLAHACVERSAGELLRHELRWQRTIRLVDPLGFAGAVVTHPLPLALLGGLLAPTAGAFWAGSSATWIFGFSSLGLIALVLACRLLVQIQVDRVLGLQVRPPLAGHMRAVGTNRLVWGPPRDVLSFAIYVASFLPGRMTWRGARFGVHSDGTMTKPMDGGT